MTIAVSAAAAAIGLVAVDLQYTLSFRLDAKVDGNWATIAMYPYDYDNVRYQEPTSSCDATEFRFVADNHRPFGAHVQLTIDFTNATGVRRHLVSDAFGLGAMETREVPFTIEKQEPAPTYSNYMGGITATANSNQLFASLCTGEGKPRV